MFNEMRIKAILKKELTKEKYLKLPYDIKKDSRIILHLIKKEPSLIAIIPANINVYNYVSNDYNLLEYITTNQLNNCFKSLDKAKINMTKEFFDRLDESNKKSAFSMFPKICINYLDRKTRKEKINDIVIQKLLSKRNYSYYEGLSDEELREVILNFSIEETIDLITNIPYVKKIILNYLSSLDDNELNKYYSLMNDIYNILPDDLKIKVDYKNAYSNLEKIIKLPNELQIKYFLEHMDELKYAKEEVIISCLMKCEELSADNLLEFGVTRWEKIVYKLSKEEQKKIFSRNFECVYWCTKFLNSKMSLKEIMHEKINEILDDKKRKEVLELFESLEETKIIQSEVYIYYRQNYQISRLLYDDNILNNNSIELLTKYKDTYDKNLLIQILANAYGNHVIEIFNDRPALNILNIDNFKIFDKKIYDKLGKGFIHQILNCKLEAVIDIIGKFAEDEEYLNKYVEYFNCITEDIDNLDLNNFTNILLKFIQYNNIIKEINFDNMNEITRKNLKTFVNDDMILAIGVRSADDLNKYDEIRKKRFIDVVNNTTSSDKIKNLIFAYVFGRRISNNELFEELSLDYAIDVFNIDNIVKNEEIIKNMNLNEDEVAMLLLIHEIKRENNLDVLKNVFESLANRNLDVTLFSNTFEKIKSYYIENVKNGLLSNSKLETMPKTNIEGVDVVTYNGEEFTLICSMLGLDLSENNSFGRIRYGKDLLDDWLTRENGVNIISTAIASSETSIYPVKKIIWDDFKENIVFVFGNEIDIVGMGGTDISSEHQKRSPRHYFEFIKAPGFDHGFSTMSELKERINRNKEKDKKRKKFDSEITITRKEEDVRKKEGGLKRTMPIGMYVIGEITQEHIETAKVFNEYYEQNGLGKFRIIQVNPNSYINNKSPGEFYTERKESDISGRHI